MSCDLLSKGTSVQPRRPSQRTGRGEDLVMIVDLCESKRYQVEHPVRDVTR